MKNILAATRVPTHAPAPRHTSLLGQFGGATPFGTGIEDTRVSRVRTMQGKAGDSAAQGTAARGRPV